MRRVLIVVVVLLAALVAGIVAFFVFFPKDMAIAEMKKQVQVSTGRTLEIGGPVDLTIWPTLGISASEVTLANPAGIEGAPFLASRQIIFAVAPLPLLLGDIEVHSLVLNSPAFTLIAQKDGETNWTFPEQPVAAGEPQNLKSLSIEDMRIIDGALTFIGVDGVPLEASDIDAVVALTSLEAPAHIHGSCTYRGQQLNIGVTVANPRATLDKGSTPVRITLNAPDVKGTLDGVMDTATGAVSGKLETSGGSVRGLLAWLGSPSPPGPGFGGFDVKSDLTVLGPRYTFSKGAYKVDATTATGDLTVTVADDGRLAVAGGLVIPTLDANLYTSAPPAAAAGATGGVNTAAAWDAAPMDLAGLRAMDVDLSLSVSDLRFQKIQFTGAQLALRLANGIADARLQRVSLYGGSGTAQIVVDASGTAVKLQSQIDVSNIEALPLLTAAIGFDKIEGNGRLKATLAGQGRSQAEIMRTLAGTASLAFNDGAWRGVNLAQIARTVQGARSGAEVGSAAKTDFAELAASFAVQNGAAVTNDLRLLNPFVRLDGAGMIDIGAQTINMRLSPRAVRSIEGQGGAATAQGIGVPFKVSGPWSKPAFAPDLGNLVQNEVRRALERNNLGAIGTLISGQQKAATPASEDPAATPAPINPLELLRRKK